MAVVTVLYVTSHGLVVSGIQQPGNSPGSSGGFDVQRSGENWFVAIDGAVARGTALSGAGTTWYTITGGVQAACIIVPYVTWSGTPNTSNTDPDIVVALTGADGSSRTLLWIEGGSSPGTVHDITPTGSPVFDNPNCVTVHFRHIACFGRISGVYHLFTSNDRGTTWVDHGADTTAAFIRCRRNDNTGSSSGTNQGQLYLAAHSVVDWSSKWGVSAGPHNDMWPRNTPFAPTGLDTIF